MIRLKFIWLHSSHTTRSSSGGVMLFLIKLNSVQ